VTVTYRIGFLEHVRAIRAINGALPHIRVLKAVALLCLILFIGFMAAARIQGSTGAYLLMVPLVFFPLLWIMPFYLTWMSRRGSRAFRGEQELVFGPDVIVARGGGASGTYDWSAITRVVEVRRFFLLYVSNQCAFFIPKASLPGPDAVTELRALLRERAGHVKVEPTDRAPIADTLLAVGRFHWSLSEGYRAIRAAGRHGPRVWPAYLFMVVLVAGTSGGTLLRQYQEGGFAGVNLGLLALALFPLGLIVVAVPLASLWTAYSHGRSNRMAAGEQLVGLTPTGLHTAGPLQRGTIPWEALMKVVETPEFFLFYQTKIAAVYLPKRVLGGPPGLDRWRGLLLEHLNGRAQLLTNPSPTSISHADV
jgi:hypothetical protein